MKKRNLIIYIIFTLVVLFTMLPEAKAAGNNTTCSYTFNGCTLLMRSNGTTNGKLISFDMEDLALDDVSSGNAWINTGKKAYNCNKSDGVFNIQIAKSMSIGGSKAGDYLTFSNYMTSYVEKNDSCPSIKIEKDAVDCRLNDTIHNKQYYNYKCYVASMNKSGKCKTTDNHVCVSGEYQNLTQDEFLGYKQGNTQERGTAIEDLAAIKISGTIFSCEKLLGDEVLDVLEIIFLIIRIAAPIVLIVMTMLDFARAIAASGDDALQKSISKFIKRLIITVIIFLIPTFINFLMDITGISDGTCGF